MKKNIIFVCTGNTCRSPMAEYLLKDMLQKEKINTFNVYSRGIAGGSVISENSVKAIEEYNPNLKIKDHKPMTLTIDDLVQAKLVLTMGLTHFSYIEKKLESAYGENSPFVDFTMIRCHMLKEYAGLEGNIADPFEKDEDVYKQTRDEILDSLKASFDKIKKI